METSGGLDGPQAVRAVVEREVKVRSRQEARRGASPAACAAATSPRGPAPPPLSPQGIADGYLVCGPSPTTRVVACLPAPSRLPCDMCGCQGAHSERDASGALHHHLCASLTWRQFMASRQIARPLRCFPRLLLWRLAQATVLGDTFDSGAESEAGSAVTVLTSDGNYSSDDDDC